MTKKSENKSAAAVLRPRAAELVKKKSSTPASKLTNAETIQFIKDLELRQAELQLQVEELLVEKLVAKDAIERYTELFESAHAGYLKVTKAGKIIELNHYASEMLGKEMSELRNHLFGTFVSVDTKPIFLHFLRKIFVTKGPETCEITLTINSSLPVTVQITGIITDDAGQCLLTVVDIGTRHMEKDESVKTELRYQTLTEVAPVGIFHTNADGYTTYVNPGWCQIAGLTSEQALGNNWLDAVHEEDKKIILNGWMEAVGKEETSITEYRFIRPNGSIAWVMGQAMPERNLDNEIIGYVGTVTDITERKQLEEKQQEVQDFLKETQLIANLGTYSFDIATGKWTASEILENIFGIDAGFERTVESLTSIIHHDWQEMMQDYFINEVVGAKNSFNKEYKIIRVNDKAERWLHGLGRLKFNEKNQPVMMLGTIQDITERKEMEIEITRAKERAEATESKFRNYLSNAPDGIFVADEMGNYLEVNPAASTVTGYPREKLLTMSIKDLTPPDALEDAFNHFSTLLRTGVAKGNVQFIHENGSIRWWSVESVKISANRFLGFVKDITERIAAEESIKKSNERFELIARATNDVLWDWDLETGQLWANEIHQQLYGLTLADPVPKFPAWVEKIHPEDRERTVKAFEEAKTSDRNSHSEEYRFYTENAGLINVFGRTLIERNSEGKPVRLIGSMMDITESKKAEQELIKSKQQFQSLVENISGVYWVNDLETYQTLYISPSYETVWGRKCEQLYNSPADFINSIHPADKPSLIAAHKNIGDTTVMNIEYRIMRPGGEIRWISAKTYVVVDTDRKKIEYGYAEDITDRKNAEEALQNAEKRLQFLLSATPAVIYSCQAEFPFAATFVSENIIEQSGYTPEEFTSFPNFWADKIHPDDKDGVLAEMMHLFEKGHHVHEYRFRLIDSSYIWIHDELRLIFDANGRPLEIVGYWINIDERKKAEDAIKISEEKYRQLFERSPMPMWVYEIDGFQILDANEAAIVHYGYSKEEFTDMKVYDLRPHEEVGKFLSIDRTLKQGLRNFGIWRHQKKDGTLIDVEINSHGIDFTNKPSRLVVANDVTEKLKMGQALAESENRLRSIYNAEPECIKLLGPKGELIEMNPAGLAMIEADSLEQVKGTSILDVINAPYNKEFSSLVKNVFKGKPGKLEFEITGLKGTVRWLDTHAIPLKDANGKIISMLGVTRDISENKKAREAIKQTNEQLRQLTAHLQVIREEERKRIGREIHDELGQQLTAIKMDVVWIDKKVPTETIAIKNKLKNVISLLDGSNQSVRRILSELRPAILDEYGLLEAMEWLGTQFTSNTGIPVIFSCAEHEIKAPIPVATCIYRVYQEAFTNITRHARAENVFTSLTIVDQSIVVMINDDGRGFNPDSFQKKSFGILGMKERVLSLKGEFELITFPGNGTTIRIILPYVNPVNN